MRYIDYIVTASLLLCVIVACNRKDTVAIWNTPKLSEYNIESIPGGALISYALPNDDKLLYIQAEYIRDGKLFTEKASIYSDTLRIEGFNSMDEVHAQLFKVNRKGEKSEPTEITFTPLKSVVRTALSSLQTSMTFGGVVTKWMNSSGGELGTHIISKDSIGEFSRDDFFFSTDKEGEHVFRGYEAKETDFGIYFEDAWGNYSDTSFFTGTPFFETMIKKPYFDYRSNIPFDNATDLSATYAFPHIWDNIVNTGFNGWLTQQGNSGLSITIDMGKVVKLSRIVIHGYHINAPYGQVNITEWEGWGVKKVDFDKLKDTPYWLDEESVRNGAIHGVAKDSVLPVHTFKDDWQYLGRHHIVRYDLMTPPQPDMVTFISQNGSEYIMPDDIEPVRYIRLYAREVAGNYPPPENNYFSMGEITFYGDDTVPQD